MAYMQEAQQVKPANILNIVATNQGRLPLTIETPVAQPLSPERVARLIADDHIIVDARSGAEFGAAHIKGAFNIQLATKEFEQRVGWMTPDNVPIILVTNTAEEAQRAIYNMAFIALDSRVAGYLEGGMDAWVESGRPVESVSQIDVFALNQMLSANGALVLDVRDAEEWDEGHIAGAHLIPYTALVPQLDAPSRSDELPLSSDQAIAVICGSGTRSSIAVSVLLRAGRRRLYNVVGGMTAWKAAGLPVVNAVGQPVA